MDRVATIEKRDGKWCIFSKKKENGQRKKLGCFDTHKQAVTRLRQIEYFARHSSTMKHYEVVRTIPARSAKKTPDQEADAILRGLPRVGWPMD